jgi:hypothetical protein
MKSDVRLLANQFMIEKVTLKAAAAGASIGSPCRDRAEKTVRNKLSAGQPLGRYDCARTRAVHPSGHQLEFISHWRTPFDVINWN